MKSKDITDLNLKSFVPKQNIQTSNRYSQKFTTEKKNKQGERGKGE